MTLRIAAAALTMFCAAPGPASAQSDARAVLSEDGAARARSNAFAMSNLVLMSGEVIAAIQTQGDDLEAASPYLDLIYARYSVRAVAEAADLERYIDGANATPQTAAAPMPNSGDVDQARSVPATVMAFAFADRHRPRTWPDAEMLTGAIEYGIVLHHLTRDLESRPDQTGRAVERVQPQADRFAGQLQSQAGARGMVGDEVEEAAIALIVAQVRESPADIQRQLASPLPSAGSALTAIYAALLNHLSVNLNAVERQLRTAATQEARDAVIATYQPAISMIARDALGVGSALVKANPGVLDEAAFAEQRRETGRLTDLTAMSNRIQAE